MVGVFFTLFWIQCIASIAINAYNQIWLRTDVMLTDAILQTIMATGPISLGAAANSFLVAISVEGTMVMAAWVKKRQFAEGVEVGKKQERKRTNAKLRAWAEERGIPIEDLPKIEDENQDD